MAQISCTNNVNVTSVAATDSDLLLDSIPSGVQSVTINLVSGTVRFGIGDASPNSLRSYSVAGDTATFSHNNASIGTRLHCYGAGVFTIRW